MTPNSEDWKQVKPLGEITCGSHDCEHDLHCFRRKRPSNSSYRNGTCVACGIDLIDWGRIDKNNLGDVDYTIHAIQHEMIRHFYWHKPIDDQAMSRAQNKGLRELREDVEKRITKYLSPPSKAIFRDGTQTPFQGNLIYYAQHATATCCRKCAEEWHGIGRDNSLTKKEIDYMVELIMQYIRIRTPSISE